MMRYIYIICLNGNGYREEALNKKEVLTPSSFGFINSAIYICAIKLYRRHAQTVRHLGWRIRIVITPIDAMPRPSGRGLADSHHEKSIRI